MIHAARRDDFPHGTEYGEADTLHWSAVHDHRPREPDASGDACAADGTPALRPDWAGGRAARSSNVDTSLGHRFLGIGAGGPRRATDITSADPEAASRPPLSPTQPAVRFARARAGLTWIHARQTLLWWLHSAWALAFGVVVMWAGARSFAVLRVAFAQVTFIWLSSLVLPWMSTSRRLPARARSAARLVLNYLNKNFYQQILFFVLPVYWTSMTLWSRNMPFVLVVGACAVLATLDVVYDRHLSVRRGLTAVFFAFNLFACLNVALPVLWGVSNAWAMRVSAGAAFIGFVTLRFTPAQAMTRVALVTLVALALSMAGAVELATGLVPPAPLRVLSADFGTGMDRVRLSVRGRLAGRAASMPSRVYVVTAIYAPLGLRDRIRHRWTARGRTLYSSAYYSVQGGRSQGFRLWTSAVTSGVPPGTPLTVDVETQGGQLVGRATLPGMR